MTQYACRECGAEREHPPLASGIYMHCSGCGGKRWHDMKEDAD